MKYSRILIWWALAFTLPNPATGQRVYAPASVLSSGNWYRFSVREPGLYKMDIPFLNSLGLNTANLPSASLRLFGNGGRMLSEANNADRADDLQENAILVVDGGDGVINGNDYVLFYAAGPDEWLKDSANLRFVHRKNLYTDRSFYFLSTGGTGKRIATAPVVGSPTITVNDFSERYFHELDTVNFLSSGKEWYGEELSNLPGRSLSRIFNIPFPNVVLTAPLQISTSLVSRSVGSASRFEISINDQVPGQVLINPVSGGQYDLFAQENAAIFTAPNSLATNKISFVYTPGSFNAQGWVNWFELFTRRNISLSGTDQLPFRDWLSVGNNRAEFVIRNATATTQVWEITDPLNPIRMPGNFTNGEFRFVNDCTRLREYIAFNSSGFLNPLAVGTVANQNLHNSSAAELVIVSHPTLLAQAQRLADLHRQQNMSVALLTTDQVYNEFAGGSPDPTSIRDLVKMYWDKYGLSTGRPKYLLLFGDASFDYRDRIRNNTNLVPSYEHRSSLDPLGTYVSDDFFGFLDDQEDINSGTILNLLDIGIGRIPAKNAGEAKDFVDKVMAYYSPQSLGPWRNNMSFIADDEDNNLHFQDAETITATVSSIAPVFNIQKIYLDAYRQESGAGGSQYPQANLASDNQVYNGTLIWNYNGHGGPARLAEETIIDQATVNSWNNPFHLPLFITATCDFAPYDNPLVNSLGENILLRPKTGAIALMTTTRPVFAFSNRIMNNNYLQFALQPNASGKYRSLGGAVKDAKNYTYQTLADIANNRKFTLLGDPAMQLAFPVLKVRPTKINGIPVAQADTLSATELVTVEGEVTDQQNNLLAGFNGHVYPTVYDKIQTLSTLANDPGSQVATFQTQSNILFKGRATVSAGQFSFTFKMPKDINFQFGNGKLSLYAEDSSVDGNGYFNNFLVGGIATDNSGDHDGPRIRAFLNDELFVNGGTCNQRPLLIVRLSDSSGINTAGTGVDHDIVATLDNDNRKYFILNDFYEGDLDSYQHGVIRFQLPELEPGPHSLRIKAWDVLNNSSEILLEFLVANDGDLEITHMLNYPNPFTSHTRFWFEHNKPGQSLQVHLQILTITGKIIKSFSRTIITEGNRSSEIEWDGRDDYGDRAGRGVYLYKLRVSSQNGKKELIGKLVIL